MKVIFLCIKVICQHIEIINKEILRCYEVPKLSLDHHDALTKSMYPIGRIKDSKRAKTRDRDSQAPYLTLDTNWNVTTSQFDITNESQEVNTFLAGDTSHAGPPGRDEE